MTNLENVAEATETTEVAEATESTEATNGLVRNIWLAGLGIYAKSFEEIQNTFDKINGERTRIFKEFVSKGEQFTAKSEENVTEDVQEETAVDKRVAEVRKKLGLDSSSTETKTAELSKKVDALTEMLSKLS